MYGGYMDKNERKTNNRQFQEASSMRKACNDTNFFWEMVNKNNGQFGSAPARKQVNRSQEEKILFGKSPEVSEHGFIDDNIPVERSGPRADEIPVLNTFGELENQVPSFISESIQKMGYATPTPIQKHAVPLGLAGVDLMCCAQTGSGKTFSFMLPVVAALDRLSVTRIPIEETISKDTTSTSEAFTDTTATPEEVSSNNGATVPQTFKMMDRTSVDQRGALPLGVVLAPTRELASQIHLDARRLMYGSNLKAICVYGGNDLRAQLVELSTGCDLIVATPGRLNDLVDRGCVSLSSVALLVLDEADRMLDMGFEPQIRRIIQENDMPRTGERQTFLFSATFPDEIQTLAREFLHNYVWIGVGRVGSTVDNIKQQILCTTSDPNDKIKLLLSAMEQTDGRTLVFVQKRRTATWLCDCLRNSCNIRAEEIHGDRTQSQRENALKQFRDGNIRILVATDVAARGLDVPAVTHVIQFDLPLSSEDFDVYVHRIGRTGRAGMDGLATALFVPGREVGEGNGKIAPQILRLLQENNQEVPDWFANLDDHNPGHNNRGGGNYRQRQPYGGGGGYHNQKFRDVRGDQQAYIYTESYGQQQQSGGYQQQGYGQQRGGYQGGYQQQQGGYQGRSGYNQDGYNQQQGGYNNRRNQYQQQQQPDYRGSQQQYGGYATASMGSYGVSAQYGVDPATAAAYGGVAATSGSYDQYGAYVPVDTMSAGYGGVDALNAQFTGMSVQAPAAAAGAGYGGHVRGSTPSNGAYNRQGAPTNGMQRANGGYTLDSSSMPFTPSTAGGDAYGGYPPQVPAAQAQYTPYQQKPQQQQGYTPTDAYAQQQMMHGGQQQAMYGAPQGGYQQMRGASGGNPRYAQQQQTQQSYGASHQQQQYSQQQYQQQQYQQQYQQQQLAQYQQQYQPEQYTQGQVPATSASTAEYGDSIAAASSNDTFN